MARTFVMKAAISSGVSRLQDLTDVDGFGAEDNMVLGYDEATEQWVPQTISALFDLNFIGLEDTPSSYAGQATKLVRVKATSDGLEFFVPTLKTLSDVDPAMAPENGDVLTFLDGKWLAAAAGAVEFEFKDLSDAPESYIDQGGKLIRVTLDEDGVEFVDPASVGTTTATFRPGATADASAMAVMASRVLPPPVKTSSEPV
jgi:hypothetical protein